MNLGRLQICDKAEPKMIHLPSTQPDIPIGVAFVDEKGEPGWIGRDATLRLHRLSLRGSWPDAAKIY